MNAHPQIGESSNIIKLYILGYYVDTMEVQYGPIFGYNISSKSHQVPTLKQQSVDMFILDLMTGYFGLFVLFLQFVSHRIFKVKFDLVGVNGLLLDVKLKLVGVIFYLLAFYIFVIFDTDELIPFLLKPLDWPQVSLLVIFNLVIVWL